MLPPGFTPKTFDCVTASCVLQAACASDEELNNAVSNLSSLLNPGGTLIIFSVFEATYFTGNKIWMPQLYLSDANLSLAFEQADLNQVYKRCINFQENESDATCYGIYVAKRN